MMTRTAFMCCENCPKGRRMARRWCGQPPEVCAGQHPLFPPRAFRRRLHVAKKHVGANVKRRAVVAPRAISRLLTGEQRAEVLAGGRDDEHATRTGRENVA